MQPYFVIGTQYTSASQHFLLALLSLLLGPLKTHSFKLYSFSYQLSSSPIYIGIECKEERIPKDESILAKPCEVKTHPHYPLSEVNLEPTIMFYLSLFVLHSIHITNGEQLV